MVSSKKFYKVKANSLLESIIALCIISVCLYISVLVYSSVFTTKTSAKFYNSGNIADESFYLLETGIDSLTEKYGSDGWIIDESSNKTVKQVKVIYIDSTGNKFIREFYLSND